MSPVVALDHNVAATEPTNTSQRYLVARHRPQSPLAPGARAWSPGAAWQHSVAAERKAQRAGRRTGEFSQPPVRWAGAHPRLRLFVSCEPPQFVSAAFSGPPCVQWSGCSIRLAGTSQRLSRRETVSISCGLVRLPSAWTSTPKALSRCERGGFSGCCVSATRSSAPARERVRSQSAEG